MGLADHTPATIRAMQDKHPPAQHPNNFQPSKETVQMVFTAEHVRKAIKSFRKGSAPGPDGLRLEHLKVAIKLSTPNRQDKAEEALTRLVNKMGSGSVPAIIAPFLSGARLIAGNKKDGGIRPIAVGNILRRLTSKCFSYGMAVRAANILCPLQMGVAVRGGLEALIHTVRELVEQEEDLMFLQVDLENAFNFVDQDLAFREVEEHFPDMLQWVLTCYGQQAVLTFGSSVIYSKTGFHQGDPLASLLFSLALHPILKIIQ